MAKHLITPASWANVMAEHDKLWENQRLDLWRYKCAYETRYWRRDGLRPNQLVVETPRAYEFIEGYIASLFSKNPSVVVKPDIRGRGNARVAQGLANNWLTQGRATIEDASRLALIYPSAAIKLAPVDAPDVYHRVDATPVPGWDVIVDTAATTWETQRYVGHRYWISTTDAKARWGNKDFRSQTRTDYLTQPNTRRSDRPAYVPTDELHEFIQVVEVYDLVSDRLLIWSSQWKGGKEWLDDGKDVEVEGTTQKFSQIPFRSPDGAPVLPIIPLYYSRKPDDPLCGMSALGRVYDQVQEVNLARTFQANGVRKAARQYLAKKNMLDGEAQAKIVQGLDGEVIEIELPPGEQLSGVMLPVPHNPNPPEVEAYVQMVQADLNRGSVLAPFTRGEATKATATEITALAAYSSSEIGRLARERDAAIERAARVYVSILSLYLDEEGNDIVMLDGEAVVIKPGDLRGDFSYYAQDGGSTPVNEAQRKSELMSAIPTLLQLGVAPSTILKEVVRTLNLPESFIPEDVPQPKPSAQTPAPGQPPVTDTMLGIAPGSNPSPQQISQVLPGGM